MSGFFNLFKSKSDSSSNENDLTENNDIELYLSAGKEILSNLLNDSGFEATVSAFNRGNHIRLDISDTNDAGRIIGKDGRVIESIQTLVRAIFFKKFDSHKFYISVDVENYFANRIEKAKKLAISKSHTLNEDNRIVSLGLRSAMERKAIHLYFESKDNIKTYSTGKGDLKEIFLEYISG